MTLPLTPLPSESQVIPFDKARNEIVSLTAHLIRRCSVEKAVDNATAILSLLRFLNGSISHVIITQQDHPDHVLASEPHYRGWPTAIYPMSPPAKAPRDSML